jgi:predicted nuclease with TOPRIM domain
VAEAPRLSTPASRLRREHSEILASIVRSDKRLDMPQGGDDYEIWVDIVRTELTSLLVALAKHRQRGADLVYEAYDVDIGGGF